MATAMRLPMSAQTRVRFEQVLDQAAVLGIDREIAGGAGPVALRALLALIQARDSEPGSKRERYLAKAQEAMRVLEYREYPELVQQIQKAVMALLSRNNDTEAVHVTRGELVVPLQLQNAEVLAALHRAAEPYGVPLDMLRVGTVLNRINPETGAAEFGVIDWISGLFKADEDEPKITFSPPFDDPAIAAEEEEAIRDHLREYPSENRPILRGVIAISKSLGGWRNEDKRPPSTGQSALGKRG